MLSAMQCIARWTAARYVGTGPIFFLVLSPALSQKQHYTALCIYDALLILMSFNVLCDNCLLCSNVEFSISRINNYGQMVSRYMQYLWPIAAV